MNSKICRARRASEVPACELQRSCRWHMKMEAARRFGTPLATLLVLYGCLRLKSYHSPAGPPTDEVFHERKWNPGDISEPCFSSCPEPAPSADPGIGGQAVHRRQG